MAQYTSPELPLTTLPTAHAPFTYNAPLSPIPASPSHEKIHSHNQTSQSSNHNHNPYGRRRVQPSRDSSPHLDASFPIQLTRFGAMYAKILAYGTGTRYSIYILPIAILLAIPVIVSATQVSERDPRVGGVRLVWFFTWLLGVWLSLWASIFVSRLLPGLVKSVLGVVSPRTKKYARVLGNLQACVATLLWVVVSFVLFEVLFSTASAGNRPGAWTSTFKQILGAILVATIIFFVEKLFVQLVSVSYHSRSFNGRIADAKRAVRLLSAWFEASRSLFPVYGPDFWEEDEDIRPGFEGFQFRKGRFGHHRFSKEYDDHKEARKRKALRGLGTLGEKVHSVFGNIAAELTGRSALLPERSAQRFVLSALGKTKSSRAMARRLWLSFVLEGSDVLRVSDLQDVLGGEHPDEANLAEECMSLVDPDGNGDVTLEEMVLKVSELCNERKAIARSMHDVSQAIKALDGTLGAVALLISVFVLVCFLSPGFSTILTTASTTLLSLSFVFSLTAQEFLGSCIFLFVKHPYDILDRVHISGPDGINQLEVSSISLLYTSFIRITDLELIQIPNSVLNTLWINNVTRAMALLERIDMFIAFDTSMEDIEALRKEVEAWVRHEDNKREFQPEVVVRVVGVGSMDKLQLQLQFRHKSNWFVEHIRATRHSKLICALVLAMRKVPIYGPGGMSNPLGTPLNPHYTVAVSEQNSQETIQTAADKRDAARLHPLYTTPVKETGETGLRHRGKGSEALASIPETRAVDALNAMSSSRELLRENEENDNVGMVGEHIVRVPSSLAIPKPLSEPAREIINETETSPTSPTTGGNLELKKSNSCRGRRKPGITVSSQSSNPERGLETVPTDGSRISGSQFDLEAQAKKGD